MLSDQQIQQFQEAVWDYYAGHGRSMPWRDNPSPYWVLVSELMLQQTQVSRVIPKFDQFILRFPSITALAEASLNEVLQMWSGLGYNRRAKFLHQAAQVILAEYSGVIPVAQDELTKLPGIGKNTAGAIMTYAYNKSTVFIETNIRTIYFHHFFHDQSAISDKDLEPLVKATLDIAHPREWYWALMDYGVFLKQSLGNNIHQSKHYTKQSAFKGSRREVRGNIVKLLLENRMQTRAAILLYLKDDRTADVLKDLLQEGFIEELHGSYQLTGTPKLP